VRIDDLKNIIHGNHINISMTNIISRYMKQYFIEDKSQKLELLSSEEENILRRIGQEGTKSIVVKFSDKNEINLVEMTKVQKTTETARLIDLIMSTLYQTITLKTENGKIAHCENVGKEESNIKDSSKSEGM